MSISNTFKTIRQWIFSNPLALFITCIILTSVIQFLATTYQTNVEITRTAGKPGSFMPHFGSGNAVPGYSELAKKYPHIYSPPSHQATVLLAKSPICWPNNVVLNPINLGSTVCYTLNTIQLAVTNYVSIWIGTAIFFVAWLISKRCRENPSKKEEYHIISNCAGGY